MLSSSVIKYWICLLLSTVSLSVDGHNIGLSISPKDTEYVRSLNQTHHVLCLSPPSGVSTTWTGPSGQKLPPSKGRIHTEERTGKVNGVALFFESIEKKDKGDYTCSSLVDGKEVKISFKLVVIKPIRFLDTAPIQHANESQNMLVRCEVEGDPLPTIIWHVKGVKLNGSNHKYNIVADGLFVKNVTMNDRGEYQCKAFQSSQFISNIVDQNIMLNIQHKPTWQMGNGPIEAYGYMTGIVNLTCEAFSDPPATYEWFKGNHSVVTRTNITIFKEIERSTLQLNVHNKSVFADYTCKAKNLLGFAKRVYKLREGVKPTTPLQAVVTSANGASVQLSIKGPVDKSDTVGYRIQYMSVSHKEQDKKWEHAQYVDLGKDVAGAVYIVPGLENDTNYLARVASLNAAGASDYSPVLSFKTLKHSDAATVISNTATVTAIAPISLLVTITIRSMILSYL